VNLGPLISAQRRDRVEVLVQSAIEEGAEVVCGAKRPDGFVKGFYYEPTVLVGTNEMRIAPKEIFGPVMTVIPTRARTATPSANQRFDLRARRWCRRRVDITGIQCRPLGAR
jgi:acyl-CoA reductase-like NAD-dependent aldehyde dehydrogenase